MSTIEIGNLKQQIQSKKQNLEQLKTQFYQSQQCLQNLNQKFEIVNKNYQLFAVDFIKIEEVQWGLKQKNNEEKIENQQQNQENQDKLVQKQQQFVDQNKDNFKYFYKLVFNKLFAQGLRDLENWSHAWLSIASNQSQSISNTVKQLNQMKIELKDSDNIHVSITDKILENNQQNQGKEKQTEANAIEQHFDTQQDRYTFSLLNAGKIHGTELHQQLDLVLVKIIEVDMKKSVIIVQSDKTIDTTCKVLDFKVYHNIVESLTNVSKQGEQ